MFNRLATPKMDPIMLVSQLYREDARDTKTDLGVGVYKDDTGITPVMRAVKRAEQKLVDTQDTKVYTALIGDPSFHDAMADLLLAGTVAKEHIAAAAATGGTGAVRLAMELIKTANPDATIWISTPTWPNHNMLADVVGLAWKPYRYYDAETGGVDRAGMWADLAQAKAGDVVLLHGCCHNPTGTDLNPDDWAEMARFLKANDLMPFVDIAYQGFGDGLDDDAAGLRYLASEMDRVIIAASAAKNFGLYRERAGITLVLCPAGERAAVQGTLGAKNRASISFPPDHGARVVTTILTDPALRAEWEAELEDMRNRVNGLRRALADALRDECGSDRFGFLADQRGMFSLLGGTDAQIARLRDEFGVYAVGGGRVNMAGLTLKSVPLVAKAIAQVL
ncbi:amino acid aminotransferase [Pararhodobacter sp.]|uniref:amino acid aminotransferase n=1 Tax=Pararhodobacter sp. TaxID=2127056 RepID=UPI002AFDE2C4|nr:amino acid aminotransferase [Pararhodobacter sp.]